MNKITQSKLFQIAILVFLVCGFSFMGAQTKKQEKEKTTTPTVQQPTVSEHVEVINAELIVRAIKKGQLVGGMKKADFALFEDGERRDISSILEVRRKIGTTATTEKKKETVKVAKKDPIQPRKKRLFFFFVRLYEPDPKVDEAIDYFFKDVYMDGDYAIFLIKDKVITITKAKQLTAKLPELKKTIVTETRNSSFERDSFTRRLDLMAKDFMVRFEQFELLPWRQDREDKMETLLKETQMQVQSGWNEYRAKHVVLSKKRLIDVANSLKPLAMEKWGFLMFQQNFFPMLNKKRFHTVRNDTQVYIDRLMEVSERIIRETNNPQYQSFMKEIRQSFIEANITFNLLISTPRSVNTPESQFVFRQEINTDWETAFRHITKATGGSIVNSRIMEKSIEKLADKEDIFYRITYSPRRGGKESRTIKLKTRRKRVELQYHKKFTMEDSSVIRIGDFSFTPPVMSFSLKNYRQLFDGNGLYGDIGLKITGVDMQGEVITFHKDFHPAKIAAEVSMKVNFPTAGKYSLILEAQDRQTGKTAVFSKKVDVPQSAATLLRYEPKLLTQTYIPAEGVDAQSKLAKVLKKTAQYCRKLKQVTFYFVCTEEVEDNYWLRGKHLKNDSYLIDYQIVMEADGKMNETRKLVPTVDPLKKKKKKKRRRKKRKKKEEDTIPLPIPNFYANYPFLLPASMLAPENQGKYRYQMLSEEILKGRNAIKISVEPRQKGKNPKDAVYGLAWLDVEDGSVLKIEVSPYSFGGIDNLKKVARRTRTDIKVDDVHWYEISRKGVRFPSRTEISCIFMPPKAKANTGVFQHLKTVYNYKNYKFFNVNVDVNPATN